MRQNRYLMLGAMVSAGMLLAGCCEINKSCKTEPVPAEKSAPAAESPEQQVVQAELFDTIWALDNQSMCCPAGMKMPGERVDMTLKKPGRVHGCGGVNRYFGPVKADTAKRTIKFGALGSTMMAGPGLGFEQQYFKALDQADAYEIKGDKLMLLAKGKPVAVFHAVQK